MFKRLLAPSALLAALILAPLATQAGTPKAFDAEAFRAAQAAGKTVLVDFAASWCPTCKKQAPVIESLLQEEKYREIVAFKADFDKEKELKKQLRITGQSTLVVFKGDKEAGRERGITDRAAIAKLLELGH